MLMNIKMIVSVLIIVFLSLMVLNHFFKDVFKLNPFYRNKILLEGFDASGNEMATAEPTTTEPTTAEPTTTEPPAEEPTTVEPTTVEPTTEEPTTEEPPAEEPPAEIPDTEKSTIIMDLFEKVNTQMDIIRTIKLSNNFVPINVDKTASEPFAILMNLKLLINNGIYKNEMDLKEMYNKYIGNKAIQVLTSDINSINMESSTNVKIGSLESSFLRRCQTIVTAHQTIIDKILEKPN
jgi:hypothetical protein